MKDLSSILKWAYRQKRQNITDVPACALSTLIPIQRRDKTPNIFLIQNKGKGPPGRSRSPDKGDSPVPDFKPAAGKGSRNTDQIINIQYCKLVNN